MRKPNIILHPLFIVFAVFYSFYINVFCFLSFFTAVLLHEYCHYFVAIREGFSLKHFCLLPYGAQLTLKNSHLNYAQDIKISSAGVVGNICVSVICISLWWVFPSLYIYTDYFVYSNLCLAFFNLLPLLPLDGSRIILAIAQRYRKRNKVFGVLKSFNYVVSAFLFAGFIISLFFEPNINIGVISLFILVGAFEQDNSYVYSSLLQLNSNTLSKNNPKPIKFFCLTQDSDVLCLHRLISPSYYSAVLIFDKKNKVRKIVLQDDFDKIFLKSQNQKERNEKDI